MIVFATVLSLPLFAQGKATPVPGGGVHLEPDGPGRVTKGAATLKVLQKRIRDAEKDYARENFTVDRLILHDACMGGDQWEHDQMGQGGLVMLLALSRQSDELPLSRVYVRLENGKEMELPRIAELPEVAAKTLKTDGTVGHSKWASIYWLPTAHKLKGKFLVDFAIRRLGFSPGVSLPFSPTMGKELLDRDAKEMVFNVRAIAEVVAREYPGFQLVHELQEFLDQNPPNPAGKPAPVTH